MRQFLIYTNASAFEPRRITLPFGIKAGQPVVKGVIRGGGRREDVADCRRDFRRIEGAGSNGNCVTVIGCPKQSCSAMSAKSALCRR